jgi:NAD dependent epimerase/dehydratase family enzyme
VRVLVTGGKGFIGRALVSALGERGDDASPWRGKRPPSPLARRRSRGRAMHRPASLRVPSFALRLALGDGVAGLLTAGQRAVPRKLLAAGFTFDFPRLAEALSDLL